MGFFGAGDRASSNEYRTRVFDPKATFRFVKLGDTVAFSRGPIKRAADLDISSAEKLFPLIKLFSSEVPEDVRNVAFLSQDRTIFHLDAGDLSSEAKAFLSQQINLIV